ncbi:MAG: hydantoinase/oxoprolinase family protein [Eubacteriaceae bacterium]|nr:hydantoinase/oxoprolinase family protein [Eubacteriaceae bacterium]
MSFILGMDTGGTYTDGVIIDTKTDTIVCKAKALTTREDLSAGMERCIEKLDFSEPEKISLISISTTLATNATVEGRGGRAALLYMGDEPGETPAEYAIRVSGQYDIMGHELEKIDEKEIIDRLRTIKGKVDAVAISGYAGVRNPRQEKLIKEIVKKELGLPAVCGHELTSALGFSHRCVTAVLNAGLIPVIKDLLEGTKKMAAQKGIDAPLMVVRGDGTLMTSEDAEERPIETLLSGPAASVTGGMYLTGISNGMVVDMGGTTLDAAHAQEGKVKIKSEGAKVGGWFTRVKAVEISTFGLGGDSRICLDRRGNIIVGPEKVIPISLAETEYPGLKYQMKSFRRRGEIKEYPPHEAEALLYVKEDGQPLTETEEKVIGELKDGPRSFSEIGRALSIPPEDLDMSGPAGRGVVQRIGFTPTDILHITGEFTDHDTDAAVRTAEILAKRIGIPIGKFIKKAEDVIVENMAMDCVQSIADFDGEELSLDRSREAKYILRKAFGYESSVLLRPKLELKNPIIAIGAPAGAWLTKLGRLLDGDIVVPENAEVANAAGAASGKITAVAEAAVRVDGEGFSLNLPEERISYRTKEEAMFYAVHLGRQHVEHRLSDAGCTRWKIVESHEDMWHETGEGEKRYTGTEIIITGVGKIGNA